MEDIVHYSIASKDSPDWALAKAQAEIMNLPWEKAVLLTRSKSPTIFGAALLWVYQNPYSASKFSEFWTKILTTLDLDIDDYLRLFLEQGFRYPEGMHRDWCPAFCVEVLGLYMYFFPEDVNKRFFPPHDHC